MYRNRDNVNLRVNTVGHVGTVWRNEENEGLQSHCDLWQFGSMSPNHKFVSNPPDADQLNPNPVRAGINSEYIHIDRKSDI